MYVPWSHRQRLAHSVAPQCCSECTPHWPVESPGPPLCSVAPPGPGGGQGGNQHRTLQFGPPVLAIMQECS